MTHDFPNRWRARWIWSEGPRIGLRTLTEPVLDSSAHDRYALLRRAFTLGVVPGSAPARITADSRYVLLVNGTEVSRGPVRSNPRLLGYDTVDLAPFLRAGDNAVAIVARFYGRPTAWWMPAPCTYTLGAGCVAFEALVGVEWIVSDGSWKAAPGDAWTPGAPHVVGGAMPEIVDARLLPPGWTGAGFDDAGWAQAHEITPVHVGAHGSAHPPSAPFGPLLPSAMPPLAGETRRAHLIGHTRVAGGTEHDEPVGQVEADEQSPDDHAGPVELLTYDFGEVVSGVLELEVDAPPGTRLDLSAAESLMPDGRLCRLAQETGIRYTARGGDEGFRSFDPLGTRFLRVAVRGEGPLEVLDVTVDERHRPRPPGAFFECSDPLLNRIYEVGLRTVDLCAHDAYIDCPTREQRAWTGDAVVHQMVDLAANPDWSLARHHPVLTASPRPDGMLPMAVACDFEHADRGFIPDWPLHWVRSVHNLYRWTGDRNLVASLMGAAEGALRWFVPFLGPDGLLHDVTGWVLIDWSSVYSSDTSSALNALWARGLRDFAEMSEWLGDAGRAEWAWASYAGIVAGFDAFWDSTRTVYVDHVVDGMQQRPAAQHGGAAALAAGLVPLDRQQSVVARLLDRSRLVRHSWVMDTVTPDGDSSGYMTLVAPHPEPAWDAGEQMVEAQPFFRYVLHDGLAAAGRADLIANACRDWQVFLDRGETTWPECWKGGTHCHGWSSTPTRDLVWYTLGITPAEPGFASVRVAPRLGDLEWVRGAAPTPHGLVTVEAHAGGRVSVDSPVPYEIA